jgi:hypothetical protein
MKHTFDFFIIDPRARLVVLARRLAFLAILVGIFDMVSPPGGIRRHSEVVKFPTVVSKPENRVCLLHDTIHQLST